MTVVVRILLVIIFSKKKFTLHARFAETDELLSQSPVHLTSLSADIRNGSFKKSLVVLNGNVNAMGDIFSSGES